MSLHTAPPPSLPVYVSYALWSHICPQSDELESILNFQATISHYSPSCAGKVAALTQVVVGDTPADEAWNSWGTPPRRTTPKEPRFTP